MSRRRGWAVVTAASGTVLIGAGAFWLSFTALADLAVRSGIGGGQAWIWPLLVDGLIVVATVAAVPPLVLLASTHLTVVLIRSTRTTTTPPPTEEPLPALPAGGTAPETPTESPATEPDDPSPQPEDEGEVVPSVPEAGESAPTVVGAGRREWAARLRAEGWSNKQIARELDVHPSTVGRWFPRRPEAEVSESSDLQEAGTPPEHSEEELS